MFRKSYGITTIIKSFLIILFILTIAIGLMEDLHHETIIQNLESPSVENRFRIKDNKSADAYNELKREYYASLKEAESNIPNSIDKRLSMPITNNLHKAMAIEYMGAVTDASLETGVPRWLLMGYNVTNMGGLYTKNPPIPLTNLPIEMYGTETPDSINIEEESRAVSQQSGIYLAGNMPENIDLSKTKYETDRKARTENANKPKTSDNTDNPLLEAIIKQQKIKRGEIEVDDNIEQVPFRENNRINEIKETNKRENSNRNQEVIDNSPHETLRKSNLNKDQDEKTLYRFNTFINSNTLDLNSYLDNNQIQITKPVGTTGIINLKTEWFDRYGIDGNGDGKIDTNNLYDSIYTYANTMLQTSMDNGDKYDGGESIWFYTLLDSYQPLTELTKSQIEQTKVFEQLGDEIDHNLMYLYFLEGDESAIEEVIYNHWIEKGWNLNKEAAEDVVSKGIVLDTPAGKTIRTNELNIFEPLFIKEIGNQYAYVRVSDALNAIKIYSLGQSVEKELYYRLDGVKLNKSILSVVETNIASHNEDKMKIFGKNIFKYFPELNQVKYFWQESSDNSIDKRLIEGVYGEVGYKGLFPIFIQAPNFNEVSKTPWKFNGSSTTLGDSGCSIFAATSLIHSAGYQDYNIPKTNLKPTIENMARTFPDGPVIGNYISAQGYDIKYRSTRTDEDLDILFQDLKAGIPYVINVRRGNITGYTKDGKEIKTEFTYGGHFMLVVSGFEEDGNRFVEVVQSSRGNAGIKNIDQNQMIFSWDELVDKKIIRSSGGHAVPAYTIIGGDGLPVPRYLTPEYRVPGNTLKNTLALKEEEPLSEEVILRRSSLARGSESFVKVRSILEQLGITEADITRSGQLIEPEIVLYNIQKNLLGVFDKNRDDTYNLLIFMDYNNAIQITRLIRTANVSGIMDVGMELGETTTQTQVKFVVRSVGDEWVVLDDADIEVTAE